MEVSNLMCVLCQALGCGTGTEHPEHRATLGWDLRKQGWVGRIQRRGHLGDQVRLLEEVL